MPTCTNWRPSSRAILLRTWGSQSVSILCGVGYLSGPGKRTGRPHYARWSARPRLFQRGSMHPANDDLDDETHKVLSRPSHWYLPSTRNFVGAGGLLFAAALLVMYCT